MLYYNSSIHAALKNLETDEDGLTSDEVLQRQQRYGLNVIKVKGEPLWRKIIEPFTNVFMLVLFVAATMSLIYHDTLDATIILIIIAISAIIYYIQRFSTERILRALQKHAAQKVEVLRDGASVKIDMSLLVPGDIITLDVGDKVPADVRLIEGNNIRVDESSLTGESAPISKTFEALRGEKRVYERSNMLFQGTFLVEGEAIGLVISTGNATEFGKLAALAHNPEVESPVQQKIDRLLNQIIAVVGGLAVVAFILAIIRSTEFAEALRFVMAVSVSAVPESLPVAISIVLVLGMRRMALRKALVRNMRAIETVGVLTMIATDKTGTLTKNKLSLQEVWRPPFQTLSLTAAIQGSISNGSERAHDPLDVAMITYANNEKIPKLKANLVASLAFDQEYAMSGNVWKQGDTAFLYVKGAPESILTKSHLTENEREEASLALNRLTSEGYRVIALGRTELSRKVEEFTDLAQKVHFDFIGFIAVADVLRPEARLAVQTALAAGVEVCMITGDHFETAYHIARKLGMVTSREQVFDSRRMHTMTDKELSKMITDVRVFSRVIPEDKHRILTLLKKHHITAMTGDGVNDVPALTNAHVGVAMGSGAQIAKDAGDIILLDNNFKNIIDAMREGRTIFANIRRMLFYLLSTNAGEALTTVGSLAIGLPIPLLPAQILWINLVTDTAMVIPLGLEPGERDIMKRPPKRPNAPILSKFMVTRIVLVALSMAITALTFYIVFRDEYGDDYARTIVFSGLVVMQWANAFNARSDYESIFSRLGVWNGKFYFGLALAVTFQMLVLFGPLQKALHVDPVAIGDLFITGLISFFVPIILVEIHKFIGRRFYHKGILRV